MTPITLHMRHTLLNRHQNPYRNGFTFLVVGINAVRITKQESQLKTRQRRNAKENGRQICFSSSEFSHNKTRQVKPKNQQIATTCVQSIKASLCLVKLTDLSKQGNMLSETLRSYLCEDYSQRYTCNY